MGKSLLRTLHIFCHVIDNFGDVGVCWRLSRQFAHEHGLDVTLWVDDLNSLQRLCPAVDPALDRQQIQGVTVRRWTPAIAFSPDDIPDIVIEAFACHLPESYVAAMAQRITIGKPAPAWINLEYLSAEDWVEGCHALPSPHTSLPLTKRFFFPGFTARTGGLPVERGLFDRRNAFQRDPAARAAFLSNLGLQLPAEACLISLFCYPAAPVAALLEAMAADDHPVLCLVPEGVASEAVSAFLQSPAVPGTRRTEGALTVQVIPFLTQDDYDRLLWACDINFVRGEDSFVRAQWAARPLVWHIYPQQDNAHATKLDAFLGRYTEPMSPNLALTTVRFHLAWNGMRDNHSLQPHWHDLRASLPALQTEGGAWAEMLSKNGDLASNLLRFIGKFD